MTAVVVGLVAHFVCGQPGPAAIVVGNGLALSSTAVVLQVRGNYSVKPCFHFQDIPVSVLGLLPGPPAPPPHLPFFFFFKFFKKQIL